MKTRGCNNARKYQHFQHERNTKKQRRKHKRRLWAKENAHEPCIVTSQFVTNRRIYVILTFSCAATAPTPRRARAQQGEVRPHRDWCPAPGDPFHRDPLWGWADHRGGVPGHHAGLPHSLGQGDGVAPRVPGQRHGEGTFSGAGLEIRRV